MAAYNGQIEVVKLLLRQKGFDINGKLIRNLNYSYNSNSTFSIIL